MSTISIGNAERDLECADADWINQQIEARRHDGSNPCVLIRLTTDNVRMTLQTPNCSRGGGGREPNNREEAILQLWKVRNLNTHTFSCDDVLAFVRQVRRFL